MSDQDYYKAVYKAIKHNPEALDDLKSNIRKLGGKGSTYNKKKYEAIRYIVYSVQHALDLDTISPDKTIGDMMGALRFSAKNDLRGGDRDGPVLIAWFYYSHPKQAKVWHNKIAPFLDEKHKSFRPPIVNVVWSNEEEFEHYPEPPPTSTDQASVNQGPEAFDLNAEDERAKSIGDSPFQPDQKNDAIVETEIGDSAAWRKTVDNFLPTLHQVLTNQIGILSVPKEYKLLRAILKKSRSDLERWTETKYYQSLHWKPGPEPERHDFRRVFENRKLLERDKIRIRMEVGSGEYEPNNELDAATLLKFRKTRRVSNLIKTLSTMPAR